MCLLYRRFIDAKPSPVCSLHCSATCHSAAFAHCGDLQKSCAYERLARLPSPQRLMRHDARNSPRPTSTPTKTQRLRFKGVAQIAR